LHLPHSPYLAESVNLLGSYSNQSASAMNPLATMKTITNTNNTNNNQPFEGANQQ